MTSEQRQAKAVMACVGHVLLRNRCPHTAPRTLPADELDVVACLRCARDFVDAVRRALDVPVAVAPTPVPRLAVRWGVPPGGDAPAGSVETAS